MQAFLVFGEHGLDTGAKQAHRESLITAGRGWERGRTTRKDAAGANVLRHLRPLRRLAPALSGGLPARIAAGGRVEMATTAAHGRHGQARGWWSRYWDAVLGREAHVAVADELDTSVSFAELVWAHFQRQEEVYAGTIEGGAWEAEYRRRLKRFKHEHGEIRKDYWCRYQASAVALTAKSLPRRPRALWRRDEILRLHSVTDWRTAAVPEVTVSLHRWQALAIKSSEILREATEHIVLEQIFEGITRLLATVDHEASAARVTAKTQETAAKKLTAMLAQDEQQFHQVESYYTRAGENSARLVYFRGMLNGAALCGLVIASAGFVLWATGDWRDSTRNLLACVALGAMGAIVSVMTRMASANGFNVDFEVGRKSVRRLGSLRPWIGATLALAIYLALKSKLLEFGAVKDPGIYFYSTIAFLAGFSERRAKVLLDGVGGGIAPATKEPPAPAAPPAPSGAAATEP
jgi:hypothetical protein